MVNSYNSRDDDDGEFTSDQWIKNIVMETIFSDENFDFLKNLSIDDHHDYELLANDIQRVFKKSTNSWFDDYLDKGKEEYEGESYNEYASLALVTNLEGCASLILRNVARKTIKNMEEFIQRMIFDLEINVLVKCSERKSSEFFVERSRQCIESIIHYPEKMRDIIDNIYSCLHDNECNLLNEMKQSMVSSQNVSNLSPPSPSIYEISLFSILEAFQRFMEMVCKQVIMMSLLDLPSDEEDAIASKNSGGYFTLSNVLCDDIMDTPIPPSEIRHKPLEKLVYVSILDIYKKECSTLRDSKLHPRFDDFNSAYNIHEFISNRESIVPLLLKTLWDNSEMNRSLFSKLFGCLDMEEKTDAGSSLLTSMLSQCGFEGVTIKDSFAQLKFEFSEKLGNMFDILIESDWDGDLSDNAFSGLRIISGKRDSKRHRQSIFFYKLFRLIRNPTMFMYDNWVQNVLFSTCVMTLSNFSDYLKNPEPRLLLLHSREFTVPGITNMDNNSIKRRRISDFLEDFFLCLMIYSRGDSSEELNRTRLKQYVLNGKNIWSFLSPVNDSISDGESTRVKKKPYSLQLIGESISRPSPTLYPISSDVDDDDDEDDHSSDAMKDRMIQNEKREEILQIFKKISCMDMGALVNHVTYLIDKNLDPRNLIDENALLTKKRLEMIMECFLIGFSNPQDSLSLSDLKDEKGKGFVLLKKLKELISSEDYDSLLYLFRCVIEKKEKIILKIVNFSNCYTMMDCASILSEMSEKLGGGVYSADTSLWETSDYELFLSCYFSTIYFKTLSMVLCCFLYKDDDDLENQIKSRFDVDEYLLSELSNYDDVASDILDKTWRKMEKLVMAITRDFQTIMGSYKNIGRSGNRISEEILHVIVKGTCIDIIQGFGMINENIEIRRVDYSDLLNSSSVVSSDNQATQGQKSDGNGSIQNGSERIDNVPPNRKGNAERIIRTRG